ncbi:hypothetical protein DL96DRAFT_270256 [Flagelloscypha sp. PMI_526]|nr:hypothetical protein DL96DRAFT_270256 [Flagelloscypha sp. PMI_526]
MSSPVGQAMGVAAAGGAPKLDDFQLVWDTDLFVIALIASVILWRAPRLAARFSRKSSWSAGHLLRKSSSKGVPIAAKNGIDISLPASTKENWSDASHSSVDLQLQQRKIVANYPSHVPTYWRFLRACYPTLQTRIIPGFTVGQALILFLYFCSFIYVPFYKSDPFTDPVREGYLAMAQLPFVFIFSAKNSVLGSLLGLGYEKLNFLHRFVARFFVVCVNIHGLGYVYSWSLDGTFSQRITAPQSTWGMVGLVAANVLFFFSTSFWRSKAYNIFLTTHMIGWVLLVPACWLHKPTMHPYIYAVLAIIAYDRVMRMVKSRFSSALLRPLPELGCTRVEIPNINAGWTPGQHIRLRVFSSAMGLFGWSEVHPFTVASIAESQEGLVLMCKKTGDWSSRLFEAAKMGGYAMAAGVERRVMVHVEGPYGGGGHTLFPSYSGAMIVAGGSGISFALSIVQDLIQKDLTGQSRVKIINLVWSVRDPNAMGPLIPIFTALLEQAFYTKLRISVYYTRTHSLETKLSFNQAYFPATLSLSPGRPKLTKVLDSVLSRTVQLGNNGGKDELGLSGVVVAVCGPVGLGDECSRVVAKVDPARRDQVGGVEIHEETFGW